MAYDEVKSLASYKQFAEEAARDLLVCDKVKIKDFVERIQSATTKAEVSRVMTAVRHAI